MYAAQVKVRQTRYSCTPKSKQPAGLDKVVSALRKQAQQRLGIPNGRNNLRAIFARACDEYAERVPADELTRFLLNTGILLEESEGGKLYFDGDRAGEVLVCCEAVREPELSDPEVRLVALRGEVAPVEESDASEATPSEAEPESTETPLEPAPEDLSYDELERLTRPETVEELALTALAAGDAPTEDFIPTSKAEPGVIVDAEMVPVSYVLYLTAIEASLWDCISCSARKVGLGAWRLAVPATPELLHARWFGNTPDHSEDEYDLAFRRFVDHKVINEVGATAHDQKTYFLSFNPTACRVIPLPERKERVIAHELMETIRAIQQGRDRTPLHDEIGVEYGIIVVENGSELVCLRGFERDELVTPGTEVVPPPNLTPRPQRAASVPSRQPRTPPVMKPKRLQDESDARLAILRDEHQKTIDRAQAMIDQSKQGIETIDAELARRAQEVERRKGEKRAALQRQLAELQRQLAELDNPA